MDFFKRKFSLGLVATVGWVFLASPSWAGMSFDDFLNYSIKDLQAGMRDLSENNTILREKCDALRSRILYLRQEMRNLDDKKLQMQEAASEIQVDLKLEGQRTQLIQDQRGLNEIKRNNLLQEGRDIQTLLDRVETRQQELQSRSETLKNDIATFQAQPVIPSPEMGDPLRVKKDQLRKLIAAESAQAQRVEQEIRSAEKAVSLLLKEKTALETAAYTFKSDGNRETETLQMAMSERSRFQTEIEKIRGQEKKRGDTLAADVKSLQEQVVGWQQAIGSIQAARDQILREAAIPSSVSQLKNILIQQRQMLLEHESQLQEAKNFIRQQKNSEIEQAKRAKDQQEDYASKGQALYAEMASLKDALAQEKILQSKLDEEEKSLRMEIGKIKASPISPGTGDLSRSQKKELVREIDDLNRKKTAFEREINRSQSDLDRLRLIEQNIRQEKESFQAQINVARENIKTFSQQSEELIQRQKSSATGQEDVLRQIKADIADMDYRKGIFSNSISLIKARYENEVMAVNQYQKEETQLRQYRAGLYAENQSLRLKEKDLLSALKKLKVP